MPHSTITFILMLVAAVLFAVASFPVAARFNLVAAGLFFLTVALMVPN